MLTVCLTHDVDRVRKTYQFFTKTAKNIARGHFLRAWKMLRRGFEDESPYWGFDTIIDIEKQYGVKSTFFFLEESAKIQPFKPNTYKISLGRYHVYEPKVARMIRYLDINGWEIGMHGSYYSYDNPELLVREKQILESVLGHPIYGIRQHYLNWNENTWKYQHEAGFQYDSTWGYTRAIGFKEEKVKPFFPIAKSNFCEIPMVIMDFCFDEEPDRWNKFEEICKLAENKGGVIVINFHNNNFDEIEFPTYKNNYIQLIEKLKNKGARFLTMKEAYDMIIANCHSNLFSG